MLVGGWVADYLLAALKLLPCLYMGRYIILGSNNFWYSTVEANSSKELVSEMEGVRDKIKTRDYEAPEPEELVALPLHADQSQSITIKL